MAQIVETLQVRLPWWWRPYFLILIAFHGAGLINVNPDRVAEFVGRHLKFRVGQNGKWKRFASGGAVDAKSQRYFDRAPLGHHVCPDDLDLDRE